MQIEFSAPEYQQDGGFRNTAYQYRGDQNQGWEIIREGRCALTVGPGYVPVKSLICGICSTDLARRHLPFPLPQITGHEMVAEYEGERVVVEINASHRARGLSAPDCPYCRQGLDSHCPERLTLGIDRLPGGFAPWFLAPVKAVHRLPTGISNEAAMLIEPLAAAIQAVNLSPPQSGQRIAVLGPRRLGMLLIAALSAHRSRHQLDYHITALARHEPLLSLARRLGADRGVNPGHTAVNTLQRSFDGVFDTTGSPSGLGLALSLSRGIVHIKSTHGKPCFGLRHLTEMVIDEIALLPFSEPGLSFSWPGEAQGRQNINIYTSPTVPEELLAQLQRSHPDKRFHRLDVSAATLLLDTVEDKLVDSPLPKFDLALVNSLAEVDAVLHGSGTGSALVRPGGAILLLSGREDVANPLLQSMNDGIELHSSRCGPFSQAIQLLERNPELSERMVQGLISHRFAASEIAEAFALAADSTAALKVAIEHPA